jgi:hypothetical protein
MSDTPETDAEESRGFDEFGKDQTLVSADFARKLVRERDQLRNELNAKEQYIERMKLREDSAITQLESAQRELDEAKSRGYTYGQKYATCIFERERLKEENSKLFYCLDASNDARSMLGTERDQLRKVVDELAYCLQNPAIFQRMESIEAISSYNSLPHVIERNKK